MAKKDRKPPQAQPKPPKPSAFTAWTETAGAMIAHGLQITGTTVYAVGASAYHLFQRFYQEPVTIPAEAPTAPAAIAPATTAPQHKTIQKPTTTTPTKTPKRKKAKPATTETTRAHSESNFSGTCSVASSETTRTTTPESPSPKTAADIKELLNNQLPTADSIGNEAQGKYYLRHLTQLKKCLNNLKDTHLENDRYEYYEVQIATIGSSIEERIIRVGQIYNQLIAELTAPQFEQNLFCMLPYSLEGSKVSGQKIAEVFEKLNPLRAILAGKGIKINFFLCGTSILAPSLAQDIDITIHTQTMSGETLAPKLFETTFLSLAKDLESIGFGYLQLILDRRCTHIVSMLSADETIIKVDLTCYNTDVEEALNNGLTNISAVYLGINGDMHATREIAEFYKEQTDSPTPKILMRTTSEPTDSAYEHVKKVKTKADHMGWNTTEIEAWLSRHSARPTLTASPPKSHESNAVSTPKTSPIVTAFRAALEAKRAAAALAVSATSSP